MTEQDHIISMPNTVEADVVSRHPVGYWSWPQLLSFQWSHFRILSTNSKVRTSGNDFRKQRLHNGFFQGNRK